jgi:hypothetical protein
MTLNEALAFAEKCKEEGVISTSAKALILLMNEVRRLEKMVCSRGAWIGVKPGFYVKDYSDGWIYFTDETKALKEAEETGAAIREVKDGYCKQL